MSFYYGEDPDHTVLRVAVVLSVMFVLCATVL